MSVINKMLQDLDRRQAISGAEKVERPEHVHPVADPQRHEWFWRIAGALMLVAVGWVGWVVYQLQPRTVATELAFKAAEQLARGQLSKSLPPPPPVEKPGPPAPAAPEPAVAASVPIPEAAPAVPPSAPPASPPKVAEAANKPAATRPAAVNRPILKSPPPDTLLALNLPPARVLPHVPAKSSVERRDRVSAPHERAEREFRRAVELLKQGRAAEAEEGFHAALGHDPAHHPARQALVVLHLERGQLESARRLLQDALALDPAQPDFAFTLARLLAERKDYPGALEALRGAASSAADRPDFHALRGAILQKLGRHDDAAEAFQSALQARSSMPSAWIGLGISLEALQRRPEAAEAFRRALAAGPANDDLKVFAEQRIRALR